MEKIVKISGKDVKFKCSGSTLLRYKSQTGREPLYDFLGLMNAFTLKEDEFIIVDVFSEIGTEPLYNMIWALAKTADNTIFPPLEWIDQFEEFPLFDILDELKELIIKSFESCIKLKKK